MKEVKVLENNCTPCLEKDINEYLKKGWKIKGNIINGENSLVILLQR